MLATEHTLLRMFLNTWRQILFPGDLHDAALQNFCTTECGIFNCPRGLELPARLSNYKCPLLLLGNKVVKSILFVLTVVYKQCYKD